MKMNMQDYRHVTDRVHIADHCKEEVLNMTHAEKTNSRPIIRIATGITAAAACVGIIGALGYAILKMQPNETLLPAAAPSVSSEIIEQTTEPAKTEQTTEAPKTDDRAFPLLRDMSEKERTKTFDWGTVRLACCGFSTDKQYADQTIDFMFDVHLNDDIDRTADDSFQMEWVCYMYDTELQHRVGDGKPVSAVCEAADKEGTQDFTCQIQIPYPKADQATCLTLGEDGEYHDVYSDFLEKEPLPQYLLYELQLDKVSFYTKEQAAKHEDKAVLLSEKTKMFQFRAEELPVEQEEIADKKTSSTTAKDFEECCEEMTPAAT